MTAPTTPSPAVGTEPRPVTVLSWLKSLFAERPCNCHGCKPRPTNQSRSPSVSHGLDIWIGKDGKAHWRATSRIVEP